MLRDVLRVMRRKGVALVAERARPGLAAEVHHAEWVQNGPARLADHRVVLDKAEVLAPYCALHVFSHMEITCFLHLLHVTQFVTCNLIMFNVFFYFTK